MMKNKKILLLTSVMLLLPIIVGVFLWGQLPEKMPTHWGFSGQIDGWSGKAFAVFGTPILLLMFHWITAALVFLDARNREQSEQAINLVFFIFPVLSWISSGMIYAASMGIEMNMTTWMEVLLGVLFLIMGNYFPKMKRNYTMGIRVPWTVSNEENWVKTHRFGGKVWVAGGLVMLMSAFLPADISVSVLIAAIVVIAVVPIAYSYLYYRKQTKNNSFHVDDPMMQQKKTRIWWFVTLGIGVLVLVFVGVMLFTGDITVEYSDTAMTLQADYWPDASISYDDIQALEYREQDVHGIRTNGFGSPRLLMGTFRNDEFGTYTRYSYTKCTSAVVLELQNEVLVVSGKDEAATRQIYETLLEHVSSEQLNAA